MKNRISLLAGLLPLALLLSLLLAAQDESDNSQRPATAAEVVADALADYEAGRYEQALALLLRELERNGEAAAPEMRMNASLCALRLLRSREAEELVAPLTENDAWAAAAGFVLGLASCQHAERAVVAAKLADAEPMAWTMATRAIQGAELQFRRVVSLRPEWPEAVRNLERIMLRRQQIDAESAAAKPPDAKQEKAPKPEPEPQKPQPDQAPEVVIPELAAAELTAKELSELQQLVRKQQKNKVAGRQQRSRTGSSVRGHDW